MTFRYIKGVSVVQDVFAEEALFSRGWESIATAQIRCPVCRVALPLKLRITPDYAPGDTIEIDCACKRSHITVRSANLISMQSAIQQYHKINNPRHGVGISAARLERFNINMDKLINDLLRRILDTDRNCYVYMSPAAYDLYERGLIICLNGYRLSAQIAKRPDGKTMAALTSSLFLICDPSRVDVTAICNLLIRDGSIHTETHMADADA